MRVLQRNAAAGATGCRRGDLNGEKHIISHFFTDKCIVFYLLSSASLPAAPVPRGVPAAVERRRRGRCGGGLDKSKKSRDIT